MTASPNQVADWPPCPEPRRPAKNYKASEVYSPVFGNLEGVSECADGTIIGLSVYGDPSIGKRYFVGPAKVKLLRSFRSTLTVDGGGPPRNRTTARPGRSRESTSSGHPAISQQQSAGDHGLDSQHRQESGRSRSIGCTDYGGATMTRLLLLVCGPRVKTRVG